MTTAHRSLLVLAALAALVTGLLAAPGAAQAAPLLPSADPFYRAPADLAAAKAGDVLRTRTVSIGYQDNRLPARATQVLYRTSDQFGAPAATVTTILTPSNPAPGRPMISYHAFYDALGSQCDPSYTLRGGPDSSVPDLAAAGGFTAAGYTVVVPDYEGQKMRWTLGRESGYAALDGIRAAQHALKAPSSTKVGMFGYSGGSVPTMFGADLAAKYAPELHLVGAAAGGVFVNPATDLPYVNGSKEWAGVIPALMSVYDKAYGLNLDAYYSPKGKRIIKEVQGGCINSFASAYPGLTDRQMLAGGRSILDVPGAREALADNVAGTQGTPRIPMFIGQGLSDGKGDGIMNHQDAVSLASSYCRRGVPTRMDTYRGVSHTGAAVPFAADASAFLADRFAGRAPGGCSIR
ncbi:lipase family protein [Gordonia sp. (in: high G+C Gram-positive bacteria)]|uniref:lipase family protein n=1 Tax=Gordonia sp. (in: high G+C Gram-positive bacteria) TaxID=84139 RepID=UPI0039E27B7B